MVSVRTLAKVSERLVDSYFASQNDNYEWEPLLRGLEVLFR